MAQEIYFELPKFDGTAVNLNSSLELSLYLMALMLLQKNVFSLF